MIWKQENREERRTNGCYFTGCDQKHEEEMDSEAIYKNFVLRVMAARSPNIRLRKALYRKDSGANIKCPRTAPAKSSKPRVALISSISKKMVDQKVKVKPLAKRNATPNVREKQSSVASKALTTPRNKKRLSNPDAFRSVRNPKAMDIANSRVVAKALFRSPNKSVSTKTLIELDTTVNKICAGVKKFEVTDGKKHANTPLPPNALRKQPRGREVKSRVYDGPLSRNCKGKNLKQYHGPMPQKGAGNNFSDMEIQEKSRNVSRGVCSTAKCDEGNNPHEPSLVENKAEALSDANENTQSNYEERGSGENDVPKLLASSEEGNETSERHGEEDEMNSSLDKGTDGIMESNDRKHILISDDKENDSEAMESDNKENASASDDNRDMDLNTGHLKRQTLGKHESVKSTQMIAKAMRKPSKENFVTDATGVQGLKHGKPKPTNPKPFRLRTDERGILKEATLEKKLHAAPLKEITVKRFPGGSLQKKQKALLRNDKSLEQTELANDAQKACEKERNTTQKEQHQNQASILKNSKERVRRKLSSAPQRHTVSSQQKLVSPLKKYSHCKTTAQDLGNTLKRAKSPFVRNVVRPQETSSTTKETLRVTLPGQLGVIKEESPEILLRPKEVAKPSKSSASPETKASAVPRQSLQGRRSTTIPKEPNFHTIHTPKSCTRRVA
uniref:Uncharacterized protein n=1 Tax=Populus trichocarpa TaxID=3694 RepID=A0A3N7FMU9_POPTR